MRDLIGQIAGVLLSRVALKAINVIIILIAVRALTVEDYGVYGVFVTTAGLVAVLVSFGLRHSSAFSIAKLEHPAELVSGSVLLLCVPLFFLAGLLTWMWPALSYPEAGLHIGTVLGGGAFLVFTIHQGVFLGRGKLPWFNASEVLPKLGLMAALLIYIGMSWKLDVSTMIWLYGACYLGSTALFIGINAATLSGRLQASVHECSVLLRRGFSFGFAVFLIMLNSKLSLLQLNLHSSAEQVGHFYSSLQFTELSNELGSAIGLVLFTRSARAKNGVQTLAQAGKITSVLIWGSAAAGLAAYVAAPLAVPILLGEKYSNAASALQILFLGIPFAITSKILYPALAGLGRSAVGIWIIIPGLLIQALLGWLLIRPLGATGAAWSLLVSQAFICIAYIVAIRLMYGIRMSLFLIPDFSAIFRGLKR